MSNSFDANEFFAQQFERSQKSFLSPWQELKNAKIFLTGGTGFFGKWILELVAWANDNQDAQLQVYVLSRNPDEFKKINSRLASAPWLTFIEGDVISFEFPKIEVTHIIHAATPVSATLERENPQLVRDIIVNGTQRVLNFAKEIDAKRFLLTSSGAVYGVQPTSIHHLPESYHAEQIVSSAYADGKRQAEQLCDEAFKENHIEGVIARCFAFSGPYLPLDGHLAIGNFMRDALCGNAIEIKGDGTPLRSYLYGADLAYWLFVLLAFGQSRQIYNVGSENILSIKEIAEAVVRVVKKVDRRNIGIKIHQSPIVGAPLARYIPSTRLVRDELGVKENFSIDEAIEFSMLWHKNSSQGNG